MNPLHSIDAPAPERIPAEVPDFLRGLGAPTVVRVQGADRTRVRFVVTLLHGNEPSGLRAMHAWLRSGERPAVDTRLVIAATESALLPPAFENRFVPGRRDLNRCFMGPFDDAEGRLARAILDEVRSAAPEALIDLHNNTGHNPAYGVGPVAGPLERSLAGLFGERFVVTQLQIGALVEVVPNAITVECGRSGDPQADAIALRGLRGFLAAPKLEDLPSPARLELLVDPLRVRIRSEASVAIADAPLPDIDFTLMADVDRHNFETLPAGAPLGWLRVGAPWPLEAVGRDGRDHSRSLFDRVDGMLAARRELIPIMMTTDVGIARSDCLFYAVRRPAGPILPSPRNDR